MASRVFALVIGIDQYKSSQIWNLYSCVDDALNIKRWLVDGLHVPRDHVRVLLDDKASKRSIEDAFMSHLVSNPAIEPGDAIILYFAGHGSSVIAPDDWCNSHPRHVDMLCTYDHDTRGKEGRVSGITDWSMHAMLGELSEVKGDNITLILDCCFSPARSRLNDRNRRSARWTPTAKITDDDLYAGLWRGALGRKIESDGHGFYYKNATSHITLMACNPGERAREEKEGGRFTCALLEAKDSMPLHRTSYAQLVEDLEIPGEGQRAACVGRHRNRIVFGGIPFISDAHYVAASRSASDIRVESGAIHGIVEGTEFSLHEHNYHGSVNPALATLRVFEVHPTWCLARSKHPLQDLMDAGWARITRWNNRPPFRVHLKTSYCSLAQWWRLRRKLPATMQEGSSVGGLSIQRVRKRLDADISVRKRSQDMVVERHNATIARNCPQIVYVPMKEAADDVNAIDAAARFHLHLHRKNSATGVPLRGLVSMGLYRVDHNSWSAIGENLFKDGKATISHNEEKTAVYSVFLENQSDLDLYPYLFWMDASGYAISSVYQPDPDAGPPLPSKSSLTIGTGHAGSEALSFHLTGQEPFNSGFLKLFLSTAYVPMNIVEQGASAGVPFSRLVDANIRQSQAIISRPDELWDSMVACITILRESNDVRWHA
ncbi:hypothetical protein OF83DRAFT_331578 [Amylostereum chailletii]|nr:hypothetical protein OF83DRAFT_331578 [Amylostereum chailletii]